MNIVSIFFISFLYFNNYNLENSLLYKKFNQIDSILFSGIPKSYSLISEYKMFLFIDEFFYNLLNTKFLNQIFKNKFSILI